MAGAFAPLGWWGLAPLALGPLWLAAWGRREAGGGWWAGFRLGWLFGVVFFGATLWWIEAVTAAGMLAMVGYLALYPAAALGLVGWLGMPRGAGGWKMLGRLGMAAGGWTGLEWLRGLGLFGFPWNGVAVPCFPSAGLRVLAGWVGVAGVGFLVLGISLLGAAGLWLRGGGRALAWGGLGVLLGSWGLSEWAARGEGVEPGAEGRAVLVQSNLSMEEKMTADGEVQRQRYFDLEAASQAALAASAAEEGKPQVDLVVWPESALPGFFDEMVRGGAFESLLAQGDFSLVTGSDHEEWGKLYNSLVALRGKVENYALHSKVRLVPFGEFIPFRQQVPLLEKLVGDLIPMDFSRGTSLEPLRIAGQGFSIVPLVCFEDTMGGHARRFIRPEPQVLVNVTNDNWFGHSPATEMHFANARWRAVELRRCLLRSANTGVTAIVSPRGEVERLPSFVRGTLAGRFAVGSGEMTFYARHGDVAAVGAGVLALLGGMAVGWRRRRRKRVAAGPRGA